jgi:hypothetical protein
MLATLVNGHDRGGQRKLIYDAISTYGKVFCPGKCLNNCEPIGETIEDKLKFIKQSKFNICSENSSNIIYCTEKIFEALKAGTVPLYWSEYIPEPNILKRESYVNC